MPEIQAFAAIRYNLGHVGSLSEVVAPPYDVIGPELQEQLYKRHPANVVRLILNRDEPGDDERNNRYTRAAGFLHNWQAEGVLKRDSQPAIYVYHQEFSYGGQKYTRRGFMARVRLARFGEGNIYPHEETMAGPKQDRLLLTRACQTNLSQVFGLYPDEAGLAQQMLERNLKDTSPVEATDHLGVRHRVWAVTDATVVSQVASMMASKPIFIADGHHRFETACNYRDELVGIQEISADHPANFVLMMCVAMSDPGMVVLPTHRLFRGLPTLSSEQLVAKLRPCFDTQVAGEGSDLAGTVWKQIESRGEQGTFGFYTQADDRWTLAHVSSQGRARMSEVAAEHSAEWRELGVAILHRLVIETILGHADLPKPTYVHLIEEVEEGIARGEYPLAALVMPATLQHIESISEHHERMPAKSTYFYPKLLSGLVFNPLN